jgi:hypothetical protein
MAFEWLIQGIHERMVQFQKLLKIYFSPYTGTTYTVSSGNCPSFSYTISSSLLMLTVGPRDQFQDGIAEEEGFLCAPF